MTESEPGRARQESLVATARALSVDAMTGEVAAALKAAGVQVLLLKGPALASWLYDDRASRPYVDCDLLVSPDDYSAAGKVVRSLGFERSSEADHLEPRFGPLHADTWGRASDRAWVDLHRALPGMRMGGADVWGAMAEGAETLKVGRGWIDVPRPAARALVVALHAAHHGDEKERPIEDLARALEQVPLDTWRETLEIAERLHVVPQMAIGLRLMPGGADLAERLQLPSAALVSAALEEGSGTEVALGFDRLARRRGIGGKVALILSELFPSRRFMLWWTPLARRGPLGLALAYPWRLIYLAWQAVPGVRAWRRSRRS